MLLFHRGRCRGHPGGSHSVGGQWQVQELLQPGTAGHQHVQGLLQQGIAGKGLPGSNQFTPIDFQIRGVQLTNQKMLFPSCH